MRGKITKINGWPSGKGSFVGIDGKKPDFLYYGSLTAQLGSVVEYEIGKPARDGKPTIGEIRPVGIEAFVDEDKPRSAPIQNNHPANPSKDSRENYWQAKEKRDIERLPVDVMLSCISSACVLFQGISCDKTTVIEWAEAFYIAAMKKRGLA